MQPLETAGDINAFFKITRIDLITLTFQLPPYYQTFKQSKQGVYKINKWQIVVN